ncbi:hypothetical protein GOP47_0002734 [Adiantum capillus-veneris]|uniref:Pre-rRNA-processing protein TSR2 homolog n=1 Tax=Adiantum capillus-veneris TaxID=13818 RepID=A0A9D4ZR75_ADICA|nr:hypothetical protein GOP47_0002734 [Adiantum capillus-veneris]
MELRSGTIVPTSGQSGSVNGPSRHLTDEEAALFHQGVGLVLTHWTALQLAIHNEWGGPSSNLKAQQLHNDIFQWMLQSKAPRYIDELEDLLDENLLQQFNTETEDGSLEEVAEKLMSMYEECLDGNFDMIKELMSANSSVASQSTLKSQQVEADSAEEIVGDEMATANIDVDSMDMDDSQEGGLFKKQTKATKILSTTGVCKYLQHELLSRFDVNILSVSLGVLLHWDRNSTEIREEFEKDELQGIKSKYRLSSFL